MSKPSRETDGLYALALISLLHPQNLENFTMVGLPSVPGGYLTHTN